MTTIKMRRNIEAGDTTYRGDCVYEVDDAIAYDLIAQGHAHLIYKVEDAPKVAEKAPPVGLLRTPDAEILKDVKPSKEPSRVGKQQSGKDETDKHG